MSPAPATLAPGASTGEDAGVRGQCQGRARRVSRKAGPCEVAK